MLQRQVKVIGKGQHIGQHAPPVLRGFVDRPLFPAFAQVVHLCLQACVTLLPRRSLGIGGKSFLCFGQRRAHEDNFGLQLLLMLALPAQRLILNFHFLARMVQFFRLSIESSLQFFVFCKLLLQTCAQLLDDLLHLFRRIRPYLRREMAVVAYAGSRPIGCVIGFLDSSPALRGTGGRRMPWNWLRLLSRTGLTTTSRCPRQFVVPDYQNMAVNALMLAEAVKGAKRLGVRRVEGSPVDETHRASINNTRMAGGRHYRTYRLYRLSLERLAGGAPAI